MITQKEKQKDNQKAGDRTSQADLKADTDLLVHNKRQQHQNSTKTATCSEFEL